MQTQRDSRFRLKNDQKLINTNFSDITELECKFRSFGIRFIWAVIMFLSGGKTTTTETRDILCFGHVEYTAIALYWWYWYTGSSNSSVNRKNNYRQHCNVTNCKHCRVFIEVSFIFNKSLWRQRQVNTGEGSLHHFKIKLLDMLIKIK